MVDDLVRKYINPLAFVLAMEVLGLIALILGVIPRESTLFLAGIFIFFVIFAPQKQALLFTVFSIPLYFAMPISESFDVMAAWRIIVLILFLRALAQGGWKIIFGRIWRLFRHGLRFRRSETAGTSEAVAGRPRMSPKIIPQPPLVRLIILVVLFFGLGTLSLLVAQEPILGLKKLIYLANILAIFFVINVVVRNREDFLDVLKYTFAGSLFALLVGYAQFITILFVPMYTFWQWWANNIIPIFYGVNLGSLLSYSNTWFSYYENAEATLRMFSVFPDSHSFALFMVISLPMALTFLYVNRDNKFAKIFFGATAVLILLSIVLSGTRGVWVGAAPVFFILTTAFLLIRSGRIYRGLREHNPVMILGIISFIIFALLFPVSSQLLKFSQIRQGGQVSDMATFERISTSFSTRELSNKGRIQIWKSTLSSIASKPFLGVGAGNYPVVLGENLSSTKEGASAHSLYLDVSAEMGILAGILMILIFLEILRKSLKVFADSRDVLFCAFGGFFFVSFLWVVTYSAVDVVLLNDKVLLLFSVLVGLLYTNTNK